MKIPFAVPAAFEFELNTFFSKPVSIRELLPAWDENGFLFEFEQNGEDTPHFIGGIKRFDIEEIAADGIICDYKFEGKGHTIPYIPFQNPSFNSIIWVDAYNLGSKETETGIQLMGLFDINYSIQKFLCPILMLMNGND